MQVRFQLLTEQYKMVSVDYVQGVFLKLSVNSDLSFELKQEQKIAVNCLLEGRDAFHCDANRFRQEFYFPAVLHGDRTEEDFGRIVSKQCDFSYLPVDKPDRRPD